MRKRSRGPVYGLLVLLALAGVAMSMAVSAAAPTITWEKGKPWTGEMGKVRSVRDIMANPGETPLLPHTPEKEKYPPRDHLPQAPGSQPVATWPPKAETKGEGGSEPIGEVHRPGTEFTGATFDDIEAWPPDTMGDVGPSQYIVFTNGRVRSFNKSTGVADGILNATSDAFFDPVLDTGLATTDPRIRFDRHSQRWFLIIISFSPFSLNGQPPNDVLIAVSNGPVITAASNFTYFRFNHATSGADGRNAGCFLDYETLGIDPHALYIGGNIFCGAFHNTSVYVVRKSSILGAGPIVMTPFRDRLAAPTIGAGPYTPQGVDNFDSTATEGYFIGVDNAAFGRLVMLRVANPGGTPSISSSINITVPTTAFPVDAPNRGGDANLDTLGDRLFAAMARNGRLYTAHNIGMNNTCSASGSNRTGSRYYEIGNLGATPTLVQSGTMCATGSNPRYYYIPAVSVSGQGHMAMGFSYSSVNDYAGAAYTGRLATDSPGTLHAPTIYEPGVAAYQPTDLSDPHRWGDYSFTSVDPDDDMTMWTIQEYVNAPDSYAVRVVKLIAPPPADPTAASPDTVGSGESSVLVRVTGATTGGKGFFDPGNGFAKRLSATVSGGVTVNSVTYVNPSTVDLNLRTVGASVGSKTITITNPDGQSVVAAGLLSVGGSVGPAIGVTPSSVDFGNVDLGATGTRAVTIESVGSAALSIGSVNASGAPFSTAADTCTGAVLTPGQSCTVEARFNPSVLGADSGSLTITSNAPSSPSTISLSGVGVTPDTTPPSKVIGLAGTRGNSQVSLTWSPATDNRAVVDYLVYRNGTFDRVVTGTSATITGLTNGVTYSFTVAARDAAGNIGPQSDPLNLTPDDITAGGWPQPGGNAAHTGFAPGRAAITTPKLLATAEMPEPMTASPLVLDLDRDGANDIVAVSDTNTANGRIIVRAFRWNAGALQQMWQYTVPPALFQNAPPNEGRATIAADDLNDDGTIDIVVNSNYVANLQAGTLNNGRITVLNGRTGAAAASVDPGIGLPAAAPVIGDVDGDGVKEIVFVYQTGGATSAYFVSGRTFTGTAITTDFNGTLAGLLDATPALVELDGTHAGLEIVVGQNEDPTFAESNIWVCKPVGSSPACNVAHANADGGIMGLSAADLDGDGAPDIVANTMQGSVSPVVVRGNGPATGGGYGAMWNTSALADVDGDGRPDIVSVENEAFTSTLDRVGHVHVSGLTTGGAFVTKGTLDRTPLPGGDLRSRSGGVLVDVTGTTKPELVFGSNDGNLNAVSFNASGQPAALWSIALPSAVNTQIAAGDVTGDGLLDFVTGTSNGQIAVVGAGLLDRITISPTAASVQAGQAQAYTVTAYDDSNNNLGDVTSLATLTLPGGSCAAGACSSTAAGQHIVTASYQGKTAQAVLEVTPGPVASLTVSPSSSTITAGEAQAYTATGADQYGNPIGDVTNTTFFAISPDGSCTGNVCGSTVSGAHIVTAHNNGANRNASLQINPGPLSTLSLSPSAATITINETQAYVATGFDQYGNSRGNLTASTDFSIAPDGSCTGAVCRGAALGSHVVTGRNGAITGTATLEVVNDAIHRIVLSPASATIAAGGSQSYTAEAFDVNDNSLGDVTSTTVFTITPAGSCSGASCTSNVAGSHTVTGTRSGVAGTASLTVTAGPTARVTISPSSSEVPLGGSQAYTVRGLDAHGNGTGDLTGVATFTIAPDGSCTGNSCTPAASGNHTVTATANGFSAVASMLVRPVAPAITAPAANALVGSNVVVRGTGVAGQTIRVVEAGATRADNVLVEPDGTWSAAITFPSGVHTITARALQGGTFSPDSAPRTFTVDASAPTVKFSYPSGYVYAGMFGPIDEVVVRGSASDNGAVARIEIEYLNYFTGEKTTAVADCAACPGGSVTWRHGPALEPGFYIATAVAVDSLGNRSAPATFRFVTTSLL